MKTAIFPRLLFVFAVALVSVLASQKTEAQTTMYITDFAGVNLNGKSFTAPVNYPFNFKAYVNPNDPGTYTWTIGGPYSIVGGGINSDTITLQWSAPGSYSVSVVYVKDGTPSSSSTTVNVSSTQTEISSQNCSDEPTLRTITAQDPSFFEFTNRTGQAIKLYWINYSGQRTLYNTLQPGQGVGYQMWLTFQWVITDANDGCMGIYQPAAGQLGKATVINVDSVKLEKFVADNEDLTLNLNTGGGRRIYPDRKLPGETATDALNRKRVKIKANLSFYLANTKIYFKPFDIDDPSAAVAPVDDDSGVKINNPDNRGNVGGSTAGQLDSPASPAVQCVVVSGLLECPTDANGVAVADFTVTMNPGDNFSIAASTNKDHLLGVTQSGTDLKNAYAGVLPVPPDQLTSAALGLSARSEMITVWRKLHIEQDTLQPVGLNSVSVTINGTQTVPKQSGPNPGVANIAVTSTPTLEASRFSGGRMTAGAVSLGINDNTANVFRSEM